MLNQLKKTPLVLIWTILGFQVLLAQPANLQDRTLQLDSLVSNYYPSDTAPGIAALIVHKGAVIYSRQAGMANLENSTPITDSTAFHIASVSKQFTSFLALLLEEEGKLSMEDDLRDHLEELDHLPYKITLRQLANHTHGLPNLFELAQIRGLDISDRMTHEEVVQMLLQIRQVNFRPGDAYQYNNTGYVLLAEVIERTMGQPFQRVLKDRVLNPLGMSSTRAVPSDELIIPNKAQSYKFEGGIYKNHPFGIMANGSSGIRTTIMDLGLWAGNFQVPSAAHKKLFQRMQEPTVLNSGEVVNYGLGLEWKKYKGMDVVFHGGGDAGYRAYILHIPEQQCSIVVLGNNNDFAPLELTYDIVDLYFEAHQIPDSPPEKSSYTTGQLSAFEGTYEMSPGVYYNIIAAQDTLYFQSYGTLDMAPLPVIGDGDFLFPYIPTSKFSFHEGGFDFHIADFTYACKKIELYPPRYEEIDLSEFTGLYQNMELNTLYEITIDDNRLVARHHLNEDIILHPRAEDSFYSTSGFFGQVDFTRDPQGMVIKFILSGRNVQGLEFRKIPAR